MTGFTVQSHINALIIQDVVLFSTYVIILESNDDRVYTRCKESLRWTAYGSGRAVCSYGLSGCLVSVWAGVVQTAGLSSRQSSHWQSDPAQRRLRSYFPLWSQVSANYYQCGVSYFQQVIHYSY